jgi:hypothetical protein
LVADERERDGAGVSMRLPLASFRKERIRWKRGCRLGTWFEFKFK